MKKNKPHLLTESDLLHYTKCLESSQPKKAEKLIKKVEKLSQQSLDHHPTCGVPQYKSICNSPDPWEITELRDPRTNEKLPLVSEEDTTNEKTDGASLLSATP